MAHIADSKQTTQQNYFKNGSPVFCSTCTECRSHILWFRCIYELYIPRPTCVFFARSLSDKGKRTYLNFPSPGRWCLAANLPAEGWEGDGVWYLWVINTCHTRSLSVKPQQPSGSLCSSKNSPVLFIVPPLPVKQVETPTRAQSQFNWLLSEVMVITVAAETLEDTSTFHYIPSVPPLLCFLLHWKHETKIEFNCDQVIQHLSGWVCVRPDFP